MKGYSSS